jgi:hypothetical protein
MSPQIATVSPAMRFLCSRIVNASSKAWVGCSCMPSPALTTALRVRSLRYCAAPEAAWRSTITSACIASRVATVSRKLSPLLVLDDEPPRLTTSALSRFPASSNEVRVRVDAS